MSAPTKNHPAEGFPWVLYLASVAALVSGEWLATLTYTRLTEAGPLAEHPGFPAAASLALTCLCAWTLHRHHHRNARPSAVGPRATRFLLVAGIILPGTWLSLATEQWLEHGPLRLEPAGLGLAVVSAGVFLAATSLYSAWRWPHVYARDIQPAGAPPAGATLKPVDDWPGTARIRSLILFVSPPNIVPAVAPDNGLEGCHAVIRFPTRETGAKPLAMARLVGGPDIAPDDTEISRASEDVKTHWNWQQLLRALRGHNNLETVWLLGSPDAPDAKLPPRRPDGTRAELAPGFVQSFANGKGSFDYLPLCQRFLQAYLPGARVHCCPTACDFEDFNQLTELLRTLLRDQLGGASPAKIVLDVTGGQKVASITGAALTLDNALRFQYVQTNAPWRTKGYDLITHAPPSAHGHA